MKKPAEKASKPVAERSSAKKSIALPPTEEDLKSLPLRAIVALAARCARRVQPLFHSRYAELVRSVDAAIAVAEEVASGKPIVDADQAASAARDAAEVAYDARCATRRAKRSVRKCGFDVAQSVANAAADTAYAADAVALIDVDLARAREKYRHPDVYSYVTHIADACIEDCVDAAAYVKAADVLVAATRADYERLRSSSRQAWPKLGVPVNLGEKGSLGKLWPDGPPKGWKSAVDRVSKEIAKSSREPDLSDRSEELEAEVESKTLAAGVEKIRPLLAEYGFRYEQGQSGYSSGGPFATGFFRRGRLEIGLIVRFKDKLGCPNYSEGHGYVSHEGLLRALGRGEEARLVPGEIVSYKARDGGDPFDALLVDLQCVILPVLEDSRSEFSKAVNRAYREDLRELGIDPDALPWSEDEADDGV